MDEFVAGDVVVVSFPFSDLSGRKRRPALVVAAAEFNNVILCQITSKAYTSRIAINLISDDFITNSLPIASYVRPDKLFTTDPRIIERKVGSLKPIKRRQVLAQLRALFRAK